MTNECIHTSTLRISPTCSAQPCPQLLADDIRLTPQIESHQSSPVCHVYDQSLSVHTAVIVHIIRASIAFRPCIYFTKLLWKKFTVLHSSCSVSCHFLCRSPFCEEVVCCRGDHVRLAVRVRVFAYPENACAVWLMFACKYRSVLWQKDTWYSNYTLTPDYILYLQKDTSGLLHCAYTLP